jgi:hypothetical protein
MRRPRRRLIRVGIIGLGFGTRVLLPAFRRHPRCRVVALCGRHPARTRQAARRLGVPVAHARWRALVDDPAIDAVAIATPPILQPSVACAAARAGKHVFCEKPLALRSADAARMLRAARRAGVAHMVDLEFPALEPWRRAKALIAHGALGRLSHAVVGWQIETYANRSPRANWKRDPAQGGGVLNLFVSHVFHYVEWLLAPVQRLSMRLEGGGRTRPETVAAGVLVLRGGLPVAVCVSDGAPGGGGHRVEIHGDRGSLFLENAATDHAGGFQLRHVRRTGRVSLLSSAPRRRPAEDGRIEPVAQLIRRFLAAIEGGEPAAPDLADGCRVQRLLDAARAAGTRMVDVSA